MTEAQQYLRGWSQGARIVDAYADYPKLCLHYARLMMRLRKGSEEARGFFDAVLSGMGV